MIARDYEDLARWGVVGDRREHREAGHAVPEREIEQDQIWTTFPRRGETLAPFGVAAGKHEARLPFDDRFERQAIARIVLDDQYRAPPAWHDNETSSGMPSAPGILSDLGAFVGPVPARM